MVQLADPTLEALWAKLLDDWSSDERHRAIVGHAQATQQLAELASLYREVAAERDDEGAATPRALSAEKRLAGILTVAVLELESSRSEAVEPSGRGWLTWIAFAVLIGMLAFLGWALTQT